MRSAPARAASIAAASAVPPAPCACRPTGRPLALPTPSTSSRTRPGESEPGRIVDEHARRAERRQMVRALEQHVAGVLGARAVHEPDRQLLAGRVDRLGGLLQVLEVVQRIVEAEDVDPVAGRALDEAPHEVALERPRADEEAPAQRHLERRIADRAQRADALPRALDATANRGVEAAAARHLERREPGLVEHRGDLEDPRGGNARRERLLRQKPYRRVDEHGHQTREM